MPSHVRRDGASSSAPAVSRLIRQLLDEAARHRVGAREHDGRQRRYVLTAKGDGRSRRCARRQAAIDSHLVHARPQRARDLRRGERAS